MENKIVRNPDNSADVLLRDGKQSRCPFVAPLYREVANKFGQPGIMSQFAVCSSFCPHFNYADEAKNVLHITCSGTRITLPVVHEKPSTLKAV